MLLNNRTLSYYFGGLVLSYLFIGNTLTQAQNITSDGSLSTNVETRDNENFTITGGERAGNNLFHSFEEFSVPNGGSASFDNASTIQNIFSRVTGGSVSNINGLIYVNGSANLFLINPQGIIFGENASLDIGGSFLATTANGIEFAESTFLSENQSHSSPILSVSVPIGLQFGEKPGFIRNQSQANSTGLEVKSGNTLALVGGEIFLEGGIIVAEDGRIELGSVDSFSFVSLRETEEILTLGYQDVINFQDIQLTQEARVDVSGNKSVGDIHFHGRQILITDSSALSSFNLGNNEGGLIALEASESIQLDDEAKINTEPIDFLISGSAGDISIKTRWLMISNGSLISSRTLNEGDGGDITVEASEFIEINGNGFLTQIATQSVIQSGNAGNMNITTGQLFLRDGGQITSSTFAPGNAGSIIVNASESIEISGQGKNSFGELISSAIFSETSGIFTTNTGDGGNIEIYTGRLNIQESGKISVGTVDGSEGKAGTLNITALESVNINGSDSTLLAESESSQSAGDLRITTNTLTVANGGEINVSATGTGEAGSLIIDVQDISLDWGNLTAETRAGDRGNITINNAETLLLDNNSQITTNALEEATGGNIKITSDLIAALDNSDITANAVEGRGGNINITTEGIFLEPDSEITATSEFNLDGIIEINTPDIDPLNGLVEPFSNLIDAKKIFAQNLCKFEDGKIAKGSSFIITGRGGFISTALDSIGNRDRVVNWANRDDIKVSKDGRVGVRQRSAQENIEIEKGDQVIQQAQGWVVTADGSVWLTADNPQVALPNLGIQHPDCHPSHTQNSK